MALRSILEEVAEQKPHRKAVQFRDRQISYSELIKRLSALQNTIGRLDGMRILVLLPDSHVTCLIHLHCFLCGAAIVPLSVLSLSSHVQRICEKIKPHFIVTNDILYKKYLSIVRHHACILIKTYEAPSGEEVLCDFVGEGFFSQLPVESTREPEEIRVVLFTAGSTGPQKGVCLSESNILSAASMMVDFLSLDPSRKSCVTVPLYDYYGFIQIFGHILAGASYILGESMARTAQLFRRIIYDQITDLVLVPFTLRQILEKTDEQATSVLRKIQVITSSSDLLTEEICRRTFALNPNLRIVNIYGLTEAGRASNRHIFASTLYSKSVGRPSCGVEFWIHGNQNAPGEIVIRGPNVMKGYLDDIRYDRICYFPCSEIRTGDLGYFDEQGEIVLLGRKDQMINLGGVKIHPCEIEAIALEIPGVKDAYAYIVTDDSGRSTISLDVVLSAGSQLDLASILELMRKRLPRIFVPNSVRSVSGVGRTELGHKLRRREGPS